MSATTPENSAPPPPVPRTASFEAALGLGIAMLGAIFIVVRPGSQFAPYSGEAAFAGIVIFMFALFVALKAFVSTQSVTLQRPLAIAVFAWLALIGLGVAHSPNLGAGIPVAADAGGYVMLLLCGFLIARLEPTLVSLLTRATIGMVAAEAFAGVWQYFIDLPQMRSEIAKGKMALPHDLQTGLGAARIAGNLVYGSFANPNSLAGYLLVGIFLLLGLIWSRRRDEGNAPAAGPSISAQISALFVIVLLLAGLGFTGSKGGFFAALAGAWFFGAQLVAAGRPQLSRTLKLLTFIGIGAAVFLLALGAVGWLGAKPFGLSMEVRLDYWRSAFGMWKSHPLGGVGLAGFADHYPFFKMPLGEEVKDAHNDYVQFAAELGILGPVLFGALWWFTLKPGPSTRELPAEPDLERAKLLELSVIIGGVLAFILMDGGFLWFDSADAVNVIHGHLDKSSAPGAFQTLALPFIFAVVVLALRPKFETRAWSYGARAGIGAVLVHQLVDFDFRSPATMGCIFLFGGMLASLQTSTEATPPVKSKRLALALQFLSLILFPAIVWIPIRSSSPRANAADMEADIQDLSRLMPAGSDEVERQRAEQMRMDIFDERTRARDAAPFDAEAWIDLGFAYDLLPEQSSANRKAAQECFEKAEQLRPVSPLPKLSMGQFFTRHAFEALQAKQDSTVDEQFALAEKSFAAAAERYPLHPGIRIWQGDSSLMIGHAAAAADAYAQAFAIDLGIDDNSVRLTAIFTDPRPGAFARHGNDIAVRKLIDRELGDEKSAAALSAKQKLGLLVRRMVALAWLLHEHEQHHVLEPKDVTRTRDELIGTTEKILAATDDAAGHAHAALYRALAYRMVDGNTISDAAKSAWKEAQELQRKSVESGQPGTPERTFQTILTFYGPK